MIPRSQFPLLMHYPQLHYLDNASTTQKPQVVLERLLSFYTYENANTYRGIYELGEVATEQYEQARQTVAHFINAADASEIIFTRGATEGVNFIADAWARRTLKAGDEIVLTELEHHANWLPWQRLAHECGLIVRVIPVHADGTLDMSAAQMMITQRTRLIATTWISNAIGTYVPVHTLMSYAKAVGARVLIDAAQAVAHVPLDMQQLKPDFLLFSGHKIGGPTGIGVLYINRALHDVVEPYQVGGGMVLTVTQPPRWLKAPHKFEAGTPPIAQAIGLGAALTYFKNNVDYDALRTHEATLCAHLIDGLTSYPQIRILGPIEQLQQHGHLVSFVIDGMHAHDVAAYLGLHNICVRAGHHCAQPLARALGYDASVRVSFYLYSTRADVEAVLTGIDTLFVTKR